MAKCYLCKQPLFDSYYEGDIIIEGNTSDEHIILNAIGGRLISKDLLCKKCNAQIGSDSDAILAKQLAFYCTFLRIERHRGNVQALNGIKAPDGREYIFDGVRYKPAKPLHKVTSTEKGEHIYFEARSTEEMLRFLTSMKAKFPQFDIDKAKESVQRIKENFDQPFEFNISIGGEQALRSIAKSAINFYVYRTGDIDTLEPLYTYIKGQATLNIVKHYYADVSLYEQKADEIIHLLHLVGSNQEKILYCYIEFFSSISFLIVLCDNYTGSDLKYSYAYDLIAKRKEEKMINFSFSREELLSMSAEFSSYKEMTMRTQRFLQISEKVRNIKRSNEAAQKAIDETLGKLSEDMYYTPEHLQSFIDEMINSYLDDSGAGESISIGL